PPLLVASSVLVLPPVPPAAGGVSTSATSLHCSVVPSAASSSTNREREGGTMTQNSSATPLVAKNSTPDTPVTTSPPSDAENERSGPPAPSVVTDRTEPAGPKVKARPPRPNNASELVLAAAA